MLHGKGGERECLWWQKSRLVLVGKWMTGASLQARKVDSSLLLMTDGTLNELLRKKRVQFSTQYTFFLEGKKYLFWPLAKVQSEIRSSSGILGNTPKCTSFFAYVWLTLMWNSFLWKKSSCELQQDCMRIQSGAEERWQFHFFANLTSQASLKAPHVWP